MVSTIVEAKEKCPMDDTPLFTEENMEWYRKMVNVYETLLTDEEKRALAEWEEIHLGKSDKGTSDWPGWVKHIGPPPWTVRAN
jgi:hypothetical protein